MLYRFTLLTLLAGLCLGQDTARKEITLDPQTLSRYVGAYQMGNGNGPVMLVTLENNQLFTKLGAQQAIPIFPESKTMFFPKVVNAEIEFAKDDRQGKPTELILHQSGRDMPAERLDDAKAKLLLDAAAAFQKRFKDQTPAPGGEAALRKMVEDLGSGKPNYEAVSPGLANGPQLAQIQSMMSKLGPLQSLVFKGVGPGGADIYSVRFEKGALETRIWLGLDGKIENANAHPEEGGVPAASLLPHLPEIDSLVSAELAKRPVGSVTAGVVSGRDLVWSKSYGEADMEKKTAADADTVYRIGSITKMFTALMLEQLVETKKVHLSDPVEKYFPEVKLVQDRFPGAPPITFIQLATHTAGLGREPDNTETYVTGAVGDWEKTLIAALPHTHYILEPGTRYAYSNIGFAILGAALARAAGEPYVEYVPKHILQPLGMTHSALERNAAMTPHLSKGYQLLGPNGGVDSETAQRENETGRGYKVPNGTIYTTVGDMAHFASFLMGQGPETVLKIATLENFQMQLIVPADLGLTHGYGIGFEVERRENYTEFGHGGAVAGYTASLLMNRKAGVGVIVLSNGTANPTSIAQRALDILSK
ncbi:MAG: serine hydrolase [Bryobacteraceae bacterium]|jgi:CubicO group peptidase (beta-lactamase class C family)